MKDKKLHDAIAALEHALKFLPQAKKDGFYYGGIAKSFEICFEYAWKHLKRRLMEDGIEVYSPKEAIKQAGRAKFIDEVELWLQCLTDRNLAVHDYLGIDENAYLALIQKFLHSVQGL